MIMTFTIPGKPIAKKRPKFARRGKYVTTYNDQQTEEGRFIVLLQRQLPSGWVPTDQAIRLSCLFIMPRPKYHYRTNGLLKPWAEDIKHTSKPDTDNLLKFVKDCCNGMVWKDDSQVWLLEKVGKQYGDFPTTWIEINTEW